MFNSGLSGKNKLIPLKSQFLRSSLQLLLQLKKEYDFFALRMETASFCFFSFMKNKRYSGQPAPPPIFFYWRRGMPKYKAT